MKYKEEVYQNWNPFMGGDKDDADVRVYEYKLVKTKKEHDCCFATLIGNEHHMIPRGSYAMREHAIVEGQWESTYSCIDCMDKWLSEELQIEP